MVFIIFLTNTEHIFDDVFIDLYLFMAEYFLRWICNLSIIISAPANHTVS